MLHGRPSAIEQGDILDLLTLMTPTIAGRTATAGADASRLDWTNTVMHRIGRYNMARRSKRNVAHHYDLSRRLYDLFLDADRQYSCAYFTDPANSLEQAQLDKKAHIAAKLALQARDARARHRLRLGRDGALSPREDRRRSARHHAVRRAAQGRPPPRRGAGVADKVKFELIDYRESPASSTGSSRSACSSMSARRNIAPSSRKCRELLTPEGVMLLHTIGRAGAPGSPMRSR
jgi:cyclopropane-fatty-acyl-phospholipid synthase